MRLSCLPRVHHRFVYVFLPGIRLSCDTARLASGKSLCAVQSAGPWKCASTLQPCTVAPVAACWCPGTYGCCALLLRVQIFSGAFLRVTRLIRRKLFVLSSIEKTTDRRTRLEASSSSSVQKDHFPINSFETVYFSVLFSKRSISKIIVCTDRFTAGLRYIGYLNKIHYWFFTGYLQILGYFFRLLFYSHLYS